MAARGEPMTWMMGTALIACLVLILALVSKIVAEGARTFWPRPIELVTLVSPEGQAPGSFLGIPLKEEPYTPTPPEAERLEARRIAGNILPGSFAPDGRPIRRQYRVGNREVNSVPFLWVPIADIASTSTPPAAAMLERTSWGIWLGIPRAIYSISLAPLDESKSFEPESSVEINGRPARVVRDVVESGGSRQLRTRTYFAEGETQSWEAFPALHAEALARRAEIRTLEKHDIGAINDRIAQAQISLRTVEIAHARNASLRRLSLPIWAAIAVGAAASLAIAVVIGRRLSELPPTQRGFRHVLARRIAILIAIALGMAAWLERPWGNAPVSDAQLAEARQSTKQALADLNEQYERTLARKNELAQRDESFRVEFVDASGAIAPRAQSAPSDPLALSQIVRAVRANDLSTTEKLGVYLSRWNEFLTDDPRESNSEGGVFPVIFGTVTMTLLLSILVVPLGVIAALYLREYASQGVITSILRIAINNLAGVPSIVFGMFGLGFFCYTLGGYIDRGPDKSLQLAPGVWWVWAAVAALVVLGALAFAMLSKPAPGQPATSRHRWLGFFTAGFWFAAFALAVFLVAHTPYFHGFFEAKPSETFRGRGLLWASLTLALLTLPVVIVATEEAIAAVPRTMREGSYGCGASKWQTISRIVLPGAMPGIMTGMILAMARGAGEVAPLMLVGAMKLAPELPFSSSFPFIHADRSFMHLGFHIFDLGFQSPDSEAARPLVWTTTLLLITIVFFLNLAAIFIRARLRARRGGSSI
jgi:ABC-type phosphate transport system permease subunit